ncbi:hypothetical protein HOY34_15640 [Xinfangfangia sp. D13-10-4-6]|uniref:hypothetical protein n=1 Tax=Pseudogemmobacter hezensis TaxID=2737662 RepID=UPI0015551567|nr:hypothetical protein [Pseudogemmobacter hezensis]NPD16625.1 hypothetical protein [Pseudogemmobacter hezensis]
MTLTAACVAPAAPPTTAATAPAPAPAPQAEPVLDAAGKARVEARLRALEPDFWTRRSRDGEAAANEWLRKQAVEISREEARRGAAG